MQISRPPSLTEKLLQILHGRFVRAGVHVQAEGLDRGWYDRPAPTHDQDASAVLDESEVDFGEDDRGGLSVDLPTRE